MAIALRNVTNVDQSGTGGATIVINKPTGTVDGDVLYALIEYDNGVTGMTAPSGWTLLDTQSIVSAQKGSVYRKVAAGEPASWTWTRTGAGNVYEGNVSAFTGADMSTVTDGATGANGNSTTAAAPTLTPTLTDDVSVTGFTTWSSTSLSLPTGYSNVSSFGSNGDLVRIAMLQLASASATGAVNSTVTAASQWTAQHILFKTAASSAVITAPLLRPATMQFRGSLGALLMGRIAARIYPAVINTGSIGTLAGSAIATVITGGAVTGIGAVVGAAIARATPTGTLTGTGAIAGASAARAVVAGVGTTLNPISGATIATALTAGTVTGKGALVGAANAAAIAIGALAGKGALAGASVVTVIASGATAGVGALSGQAVGTAVTTGTVSTVVANPISGTTICTAVASGAVTGKGAVAGSTNAAATASGALQAKGALAGSSVVTVQTIGFVANIPTPNISGDATCSVTVSGLFTAAPQPVSQPPPTGGSGNVMASERAWQQRNRRTGHGAFTLPGNSMRGTGSVSHSGQGAFQFPMLAFGANAHLKFDSTGVFELDQMGLRVWSSVENKTYASALSMPSMSGHGNVSMDDREEEEIIIKLLYEN